MRKSCERRGSRISRTFLPAATPSEPLPLSANTPVSYFYKVQGNVKLLETADYGQQVTRRDRSFTGCRFRLSKRLELLSRTRVPRVGWQEQQEGEEEGEGRRVRRRASLRDPVGDGVYEMEVANINKTISGTRLGALSALQIMEEMEADEQQQGSTFHGYDRLVKRMDSEVVELPVPRRLAAAPQRKRSIAQGKGLQRHMETIYGGEEGFLDKYREYQMSLLEKIPSYRSRHLTLDYKNEWRL